jgi:hypothetical protein
LRFVATGGQTGCTNQSKAERCESFEVAHDLAPFASVLLP